MSTLDYGQHYVGSITEGSKRFEVGGVIEFGGTSQSYMSHFGTFTGIVQPLEIGMPDELLSRTLTNVLPELSAGFLLLVIGMAATVFAVTSSLALIVSLSMLAMTISGLVVVLGSVLLGRMLAKSDY